MEIQQMVELWLRLRDDPRDLKSGIQRINSFLKRSDFERECAYYDMLHQRYLQ